jgi:hypothetical protein
MAMRGERRLSPAQPSNEVLPQSAQQRDLEPTSLALVREGLNHVFAGTRRLGTTVIIRLTDDMYRSASLIRAEFEWLRLLRQHGCSVTTPLLATDGQLLKTLDTGGPTLHAFCFGALNRPASSPRRSAILLARWDPSILLASHKSHDAEYC